MKTTQDQKRVHLTDEDLNKLPLSQKNRIIHKRKVANVLIFFVILIFIAFLASIIMLCVKAKIGYIIFFGSIPVEFFLILKIDKVTNEECELVKDNEQNLKLKMKKDLEAIGKIYIDNPHSFANYFYSFYGKKDTCPVCGQKLDYNNNCGTYTAKEIQKKELEGVYVTKGYLSNEVEQAVTYKEEERDFPVSSYHCPHCEYTIYHAKINYYSNDEYKINENDGIGTRIGWFEHTKNVYAVDQGKMPDDTFEKVKSEFAEKKELVYSFLIKKTKPQ